MSNRFNSSTRRFHIWNGIDLYQHPLLHAKIIDPNIRSQLNNPTFANELKNQYINHIGYDPSIQFKPTFSNNIIYQINMNN